MQAKNSNKFYLLIALILFTSFYSNASEQKFSSVVNTFSTIPLEDQKTIKSLFKGLFSDDAFAYSLFGDKPLSFSDAYLDEYSPTQLLELISIDGYVRYNLETYSEPPKLSKKNWEVWSKYKNKFEFKKYIFFNKKLINQNRLFILNKDAFIKVVNNNIDLFRKIINNQITAEKLIYQIESEDKGLLEILNDNVGLLGILLGFGRYNSLLFQRREDLSNSFKQLKNLDKIQEEIDAINNKLQVLNQYDFHIIASINRVGFVAEQNHPETIKLKNKYDALSKKIREIYSKDDWLEQTLLQLSSE